MSRQARIAIIGAGLGGTVAAILLQRAGYAVTVYEQATQLVRLGAGINLDPHIMRIMRRLGLEAQLLAKGRASQTRQSRDWDTGRVTFDTPVAKYPALYGGNHFSIHRGDLQDILASAVAPGVVQLGKRLTDLEEDDEGVQLSFADGTRAAADLVIGADGINSRIREILLGPEAPIYTGAVAYRAVFPSALLGDLQLPDHCKWWSEQRYFLTYFLTHSRDEFYFMTMVPEPDWGGDSYAPQAADMDRVRAHYVGFHPDVLRVLEACPGATRWPVLEREPFPCWSRGRTVLLGDACHPMAPHMGQGAAMAFEDAVVLVRCIQQVGADRPEQAFHLYEANRFERASRVQAESLENRWLRYPMDPGWVFHYDAFEAPLQAKVAA